MNYLIQVKQTPSKVNKVLVEGSIFVELTTFCFVGILLHTVKIAFTGREQENLRVKSFDLVSYLSLSFLICKMGMRMTTLQSCCLEA